MRKSLFVALAGLIAAASAHAVPVSDGGGFIYEYLEFSGSSGSVLSPMNSCPGPDASHRCASMNFDAGVGGTLTATAATAGSPGVVYQDLPQAERGLGVVPGPSDTSDTWISGTDVLKLSFSNAVNLVGYHVYQRDDAPGTDHFEVSKDGLNWETRSFASVVFTQWHSENWLTDTRELWFRADDAEKFYVGAVKITSAIPEPETYALMLAGLGLVGMAARRRRVPR